MKPQRIQLSRRAGFNLQAASFALNGLPAVNVARPSKWGNPFAVPPCRPERKAEGHRVTVNLYAAVLECRMDKEPKLRDEIKRALAGRNLACWCPAGLACHTETLLAIANA